MREKKNVNRAADHAEYSADAFREGYIVGVRLRPREDVAIEQHHRDDRKNRGDLRKQAVTDCAEPAVFLRRNIRRGHGSPHREGNAVLSIVPGETQKSTVSLRRNSYDELFDRRIDLPASQIDPHQILVGVVVSTPLTRLAVEDQLCFRRSGHRP